MEQKNADNLFGKLAQKLGLINDKQLQEALELQRFMKHPKPLGVILQKTGAITEDGLKKIIEYQTRELMAHQDRSQALKEDNLFGKVLIRMGFVRPEQVDACVTYQKTLTGGKFKRLGEIMVEKGYIRAEHVYEVLKSQDVMIVNCPKCQTKYNAIMFNPGVELTCYKCNEKFTLKW